MKTSMPNVKIVGEENILAEIIPLVATLDFSKVKRGPSCKGCYSVVFETTCGHPYIYRKRCQHRAPVCVGSDILTVFAKDVIVKNRNCRDCQRIKTDNERLKVKLMRRHTPKKTAARMRMEQVKERWARQLLEAEIADRNRLSSGSVQSPAPRQGRTDHVEEVDLTVEQQA